MAHLLGSDQRVNWLREKARAERWREEVILVESEMKWTQAFFRYHSAKWTARKDDSTDGAKAYAARQAAMWSRFVQEAGDELGRRLDCGDRRA